MSNWARSLLIACRYSFAKFSFPLKNLTYRLTTLQSVLQVKPISQTSGAYVHPKPLLGLPIQKGIKISKNLYPEYKLTNWQSTRSAIERYTPFLGMTHLGSVIYMPATWTSFRSSRSWTPGLNESGGWWCHPALALCYSFQSVPWILNCRFVRWSMAGLRTSNWRSSYFVAAVKKKKTVF